MTQATASQQAHELTLVAPVDGVIVPLENLPDPVFAEKMLGDGVSIDPTSSTIVAPCDGLITQFHRARHALTLKTDAGVSVLLHVGLDTVTLKGKGFSPLVSEGERVNAGQALLEFDLDAIAQGALSAQVEIVVTEGAGGFAFQRQNGVVSAGKDEILRIAAAKRSADNSATKDSASEQLEEAFEDATIVNPHGMHARPAARLAKAAKSFSATLTLRYARLTVSAESITDIMSLDLEKGSTLQILGKGPDAKKAVAALGRAIAAGLGEGAEDALLPTKARFTSDEEGVLGGVPASPGLAIGTVVLRVTELPQFEDHASDSAKEKIAFERALLLAKEAIAKEECSYKKDGENEKVQIFAAHGELLEDASLVEDALASIAAGATAARAWQDAIDSRARKFGTLKSQLLRQRATDMRDVGLRVLHGILGSQAPSLKLTSESVLVCDDLTPSAAASLKADSVGAIVTELGGSTSHAAIIARSMGIPYVAGLGSVIKELTSGMQVVVDGSRGAILLDPEDKVLEESAAEIERLKKIAGLQQEKAHGPAETIDGTRIEVAANIGNVKDALNGVDNGCDGVGLLRSEFLFLNRREAPSEEEQRQEYEEIGKVLGPDRSLVIRSLDVGGDKPLAYMPLEEEENPFLGVRGLRVSLKYPELFRSQIRAALSAAKHTRLNIMFPMVSQPHEFTLARQMVLEEIQKSATQEDVAIGVMVEVPSAALNARWLAKEADFFSIGTNDLTQYTLAMDRGHPELSKQADAFDPAVLRLIQMTAEAAHAEGKWVGVCGGLAAEPLALPLLIGLGIDELSVPAPVIPQLKSQIRALHMADCQAVAEGALALPSPESVRSLLENFHES